MNSEKVKEIKKALEEYIRQYSNFKGAELCKEALTLINGLEKENNRILERNQILEKRVKDLEKIGLNEGITVGEYLREFEKLINENRNLRIAKVVYESDYCYENLKKAEKRIAELEKEIEENAFYSKGYMQGIKNTYEVVIPDKLKQFAERLKENMPVHYTSVIDSIDETLKEFINE